MGKDMEMRKATAVEEITAELKNQIRLEGLSCDVREFAPFSQDNIPESLTEEGRRHLQESEYCAGLLETTPVVYRREVRSHFRFLSFIVKPIKKLIRKLVRFLLEPMVEEINANRLMTATALSELQACLRECEESLSVMSGMIAEMRSEIEVLKADDLYLKETVQACRKGEADA